MKDIKVFQSTKDKMWVKEQSSIKWKDDINLQEMQLLMVYDDIKYQEIKGFGGTFTEASAMTYAQMNPEKQSEILEMLFGKTGLKYTCSRKAIGSCDASRGNYSCCDKADEELVSFNIDKEKEYVVPLIKDAMEVASDMEIMASPWSPPVWLKTNGDMLHGGKLKKEYYGIWAKYFVKYIEEYKKEGIETTYVSVQNEPQAVQIWESCVWDEEEEKVFIRDFLYPALQEAGLNDVKIVVWDHNKERVFERARYIMADEMVRNMIAGFAFHWYSGDHFENVALCREMFPDKELLFTEGCVELAKTDTTMAEKANQGNLGNVNFKNAPYEFGECYAHDMIGNFNSGMNRYIDWSMLLNENGGPNHVNNYCSAPIMCDTNDQEVILQSTYYFISHFSSFVPPGSRRIAHSKYTEALEMVAFLTPANERVVVLMNTSEHDIPYVIKDVSNAKVATAIANAKSIYTLVF